LNSLISAHVVVLAAFISGSPVSAFTDIMPSGVTNSGGNIDAKVTLI